VTDPAPIVVERTDSDCLLIAFGGVADGVNMAPFEFWRATRSLPHNRIFVRDQNRGWYLTGIGDGLDDWLAIWRRLERLVVEIDPRTITVVGASAGGYAAILFGCLLDAHVVHAFGPQTTLDVQQLAAMRDGRWERALGPVRGLDHNRDKLDLRRWYGPADSGGTEYHIHACEGHRADRLHVERMRGLRGFHVHLHPCRDHMPARYLRNTGALARLLAPIDREGARV